MPSTPSQRLRVELQALGENLSTWGDTRLNEALKRLEEGQAKVLTKAITGDVTLLSQNYVEDEARSFVLVLTGAPGATFKITIPGAQKPYFVVNKTNAAQQIGASGGLAASVPAGRYRMVYCDGTDTFTDDPSISQLPKPTGNIDMSSIYTLVNLPDATSNQQPATKKQVDDVRAYAAGISNSGILADGSTIGRFLKWYGKPSLGYAGWSESDIPSLIAGSGTTVSGSFTTGDMRVNVDAGTTANKVPQRDAGGHIPALSGAWVAKTANYAAVNGDHIFGDTSGGAFTVTLPVGIASDIVVVTRSGAYNLTVARNGGTGTIAGDASDLILDSNGVVATLICTAPGAWKVVPGLFK